MSKNIAVIYVSRHHGNTEKLVRGIAAGTGIRIIPLEKALEEDFSGYDAVGLASGIYGFSFDPELAAFALQTDKLPHKVFLVYTSAMDKDRFALEMSKKLEQKGHEVIGIYHCKGYNTFGPFKLIGGTAKGHPDEEDIWKGQDFIRRKIGLPPVCAAGGILPA